MSQGPHAFKITDVVRAVKGARAAGLPVKALRFDKNGFTLISGETSNLSIVPSGEEQKNEWDGAIYGDDQAVARK
jgi:hypothetical protein